MNLGLMNRKAKGTNAERDLVHKFWKRNWPCIRVAGSGSTRYPSPDILAGNRERMVAIECKTINGIIKYFPKEEISLLKEFCDLFGAEPWVALKFGPEQWYFLSLDDLKETNKSYIASLSIAKMKGFILDEFIGIFKR